MLVFSSCVENESTGEWIKTKKGATFFVSNENAKGGDLSYVWSGKTLGGLIHGEGVLSIFSGDTLMAYYGARLRTDYTIRKNDTRLFLGNYPNGKAAVLKGDYLYFATYIDGKITDESAMITKHDQMYYKGGIIENKYDGFGTYYNRENNIHYRGFWKEGRFDRYGVLYKDGVLFYDGQYENGLPHGRGLSYKDGAISYSGSWEEGKFHGSGTAVDNMGVFSGKWDEGAYVFDAVKSLKFLGWEANTSSIESQKPYTNVASYYNQIVLEKISNIVENRIS